MKERVQKVLGSAERGAGQLWNPNSPCELQSTSEDEPLGVMGMYLHGSVWDSTPEIPPMTPNLLCLDAGATLFQRFCTLSTQDWRGWLHTWLVGWNYALGSFAARKGSPLVETRACPKLWKQDQNMIQREP